MVGVRGTFEEEFGELYGSARAVAFRILGSVAESEDAAAEALTRALVDWNRVGRLAHREAWVQRVAANVALDAVRRRGPADRAMSDLRSRFGTGASADQQVEAVLRLTMVAALGALPRRQREAIVLRHLLGYPEAAVSEALGMSSNSVKKHLQRGMVKLRRLAVTDATCEGGIDAAFE